MSNSPDSGKRCPNTKFSFLPEESANLAGSYELTYVKNTFHKEVLMHASGTKIALFFNPTKEASSSDLVPITVVGDYGLRAMSPGAKFDQPLWRDQYS